jgi:hypothetical protein
VLAADEYDELEKMDVEVVAGERGSDLVVPGSIRVREPARLDDSSEGQIHDPIDAAVGGQETATLRYDEVLKEVESFSLTGGQNRRPRPTMTT